MILAATETAVRQLEKRSKRSRSVDIAVFEQSDRLTLTSGSPSFNSVSTFVSGSSLSQRKFGPVSQDDVDISFADNPRDA